VLQAPCLWAGEINLDYVSISTLGYPVDGSQQNDCARDCGRCQRNKSTEMGPLCRLDSHDTRLSWAKKSHI
jgi:hypothetical protein